MSMNLTEVRALDTLAMLEIAVQKTRLEQLDKPSKHHAGTLLLRTTLPRCPPVDYRPGGETRKELLAVRTDTTTDARCGPKARTQLWAETSTVP
jgi:hypothetical protein